MVMERSPLTGRLFVDQLAKRGIVPKVECDLMQEWFQMIDKFLDSHVDVVRIYLRAAPSVSLTRVRARARDGEESVDEELLQDLHDLHDRHFLSDGVHVLDAGRLSTAELAQRVHSIIASV